MCLAIPAQIQEIISPEMAKADIGGVIQEVITALVQPISIGDWVLVHTGYAIEKIDPEEAKKTLELWEEVLGYMDNDN
ncbi:MAG: HypC/HybG/HupF family hydrogenase formation chaperone [Promethearchaeota archaeon]